MLYSTCPSCGTFLSKYIIQWEKDSLEICNNPKLTSEEKEKKTQELLLSLKIRRYCCRMRVMTYKDIVQDILPIQENDN